MINLEKGIGKVPAPLPFLEDLPLRHTSTIFILTCFFLYIGRLWNSLPIECFLLTYDLNGSKFRINRHLLSVGSFKADIM